MSQKILLNNTESVYLDTSFILYALTESMDRRQNLVKKSIEALWLILYNKSDNTYISNIVISELFHALERSWFQWYIDKKIINILGIDEMIWKNYNKQQRDSIRREKTIETWFNLNEIKEWRKPEYKIEYKSLVCDEFENIISSLPEWINVLTNFSSPWTLIQNFIRNKNKYRKLDANDVNHYLLCKEHWINWILTCDNDFDEIHDSDLDIIIINREFTI